MPKEWVAKGKKVVLLDPYRKMIFDLANSSLAKKSTGDYVEVVGPVEVQAKTFASSPRKACPRPKL